jgi:rhodanese-related sulfurtransferase
MITPITRNELRRRLAARPPLVLIEALPPRYYEQAHLPGALNIPHDAVDTLAPRLLSDKDAEIVVYCASSTCKNSGIAAQRLMELGYRNVRTYDEGKADWIAAGLDVESGADRAQRSA